MNTQNKITFPKVYASPTQSKYGSASIYTVANSYSPFDATAPGMSTALSLARAEYAVKAINEHDALVAVADAAKLVVAGVHNATSNELTSALSTLSTIRKG